MLLTARNLNVVNILLDINLEIDSGDWLTIVGPSGSGKSTLLKALARLENGVSGNIELLGKPVQDYDLGQYRQEVSYAVQSASLFGNTVQENLDLPFVVRGLAVDHNRQVDFLKAVDLPGDYLTQKIEDLSGGQRQRVALIRNLINPPKALLLDEITTGLDEVTKTTVWHFIQEQQTKHHFAVLSVTHDQQEIQLAQKILKISGGRIDAK